MSIDELRADFDRASSDVVPVGDPFGRLIDRRRRRLRHRIGGLLAAAAAVIAAAVLAPLALQAGFPGNKGFEGYRVESEWTWKMLRAPTRGNLSSEFDAELTTVFDQGRRKAGIGNSLPNVKVLFSHESKDVTQVVVAYHSDTHAAIVTRAAGKDAKAEDVLAAKGTNGIRPAPFLVTYSGLDTVIGAVVGLAPQGCEITSSVSALMTADKGESWKGLSWQRSYRAETDPSFAINFVTEPAEVWQVTCAGEVREVRPARQIHEVTAANYSLGGEGRGNIDRPTENAAAAVYTSLHFAVGVGGPAQTIWGGRVPGTSEGSAALLASETSPGIVVLHFGTTPKAMIALEPEDSHLMPTATEAEANARAQWSISSTGYTASNQLIAIRIPKRESTRAVLSEQVLVVGPADATRAEATDGSGKVIATTDLTNGVGVLTLAFGAAALIDVTGQAGSPLVTTLFLDHWTGPRIFGDQLVTSWQ